MSLPAHARVCVCTRSLEVYYWYYVTEYYLLYGRVISDSVETHPELTDEEDEK